MKQKIILWIGALFLLMVGAGCEKKTDITTDQQKIGNVVEVFELAYGQSKEIIYGEKDKFIISLRDIKDDVTINCSLADFKNNEEYASVRVYSYLKVDNERELIKVSSKPCGALKYKGNGDEVKDLTRLIEDIKAAPANVKNPSFFSDHFMSLFGEGTPIKQGSFRIFIGKVSLNRYTTPEANAQDYKFIFILTKQSSNN